MTEPLQPVPSPGRRELLPLPGLAAIGLYLFLLAGTIVFGVVAGRHYPPLFLVFSVALIAAGAGLLMLFRWAWALALAAVALLAAYHLWFFTAFRNDPSIQAYPSLVQGFLNLLFFLYLVRPEVRSRLR